MIQLDAIIDPKVLKMRCGNVACVRCPGDDCMRQMIIMLCSAVSGVSLSVNIAPCLHILWSDTGSVLTNRRAVSPGAG